MEETLWKTELRVSVVHDFRRSEAFVQQSGTNAESRHPPYSHHRFQMRFRPSPAGVTAITDNSELACDSAHRGLVSLPDAVRDFKRRADGL
jgi:hypothetical protein